MSEMFLILKVVREDMTSHEGFKWPESGRVVPENWDPAPECGNGLHGWLNGEGGYRHLFMDGKWIIFEAKPEDVVSLDGGEKVKAKEGNVVYAGNKAGAITCLKLAGALSERSNPGWCCFSNDQLRKLAFRAANRAKRSAIKALRATQRQALLEHAASIEALPDITEANSATAASSALRNAANAAANAAAYAATAAANAADAAYSAFSANYAAANAAANAATAAAYAAYDAEHEEQRLDKLELLGFKVR